MSTVVIKKKLMYSPMRSTSSIFSYGLSEMVYAVIASTVVTSS